MRSVVSAGMVTALEYLGLLGVFDAVYGSSGGAYNGAFFLAKQAAYGTTIYYENINTEGFISLRRLFSPKPIVSLEYILENVIIKEKILDWRAVLDSPIPLNVIVSSLGELRAKAFTGFRDCDSFFAALHASSKMPLVSGPPVEFDGDRFLDASVFEAIPVHAALRDHCTHVLVLLTRPNGHVRTKANLLDRHFLAKRLERLQKGLGTSYLGGDRDYSTTISLLQKAERDHNELPFMFPISLPADSRVIGKMEKDRTRLINGAKDGMRAVFKTLACKEPELIEILTPFDACGHVFRDAFGRGK